MGSRIMNGLFIIQWLNDKESKWDIKARKNIIFFTSIFVSFEKKTSVLYRWGGEKNSQFGVYEKKTDSYSEIDLSGNVELLTI